MLRSTLRLLLFAAASLLSATGALAQAVIDSELRDALTASAGGTAEVIVTFHGNSAPGAADLDVLRAVGINGGITFRSLPMVGAVATLEQVNALASSPRVRSVFYNKRLEYYNYDARQLTGVDRLRANATLTRMNRGLPVTGRGVGLYIADSGIDATHPDLKLGKNVIQNVWAPINKDLVYDETGFRPVVVVEDQPNTDNGGSGHGTHVAGTAGGTGQASAGKQAGVASGANIVGYGSGATIFVLNAVGSFDYLLVNQARYGIRVMNNSWGSSGDFNPDHPVNVASRIAAEDRNVVVVFSAGNGTYPNSHNPYAKAPWVISVANGTKDGKLSATSSKGTPGGPRTVTAANGEVITWLDEPTVTAPGTSILSVRASVGVLGGGTDPFYATMSGTSMAAPHVAGIVALMLEANPLLTPSEVKQILKETATHMPNALPGREYKSFEVGAGYVNAFAAVQKSFDLATPFGKPLQGYEVLGRADLRVLRDHTFDFSPLAPAGTYKRTFTVEPGADRLEVEISFDGIEVPVWGNAANSLTLDVFDPNRNRYYTYDLLFAIYETTRLVVVVPNPIPGTWTMETKMFTLFGTQGNAAAAPDRVREQVRTYTFETPAIGDLQGHADRGSIEWALTNGFLGLCATSSFCPDQAITRGDFARSFTQFGAVRQYLPFNGGSTFGDVSAADKPFVEAVATQGAALRDREFRYAGVIEGSGTSFNPGGAITRAELARMLVRGIGGEAAALGHSGDVTVAYNGQTYVVADQDRIPAALRGYAHTAINSNMLSVFWRIEQGPVQAELRPYFYPTADAGAPVSRADAAVAISRYHAQYFR
ncbi:MAG TPA: S8 family serine peptidase [Longimicrobiaceae bacterium]|nr:S8 family serine peptidase [Longimicrobiaceae bacterium]